MNYLILLPKVKQPRNQQTEMTSLEDPNGQAQATYFQESVSTTGNSTPTVTQSNDPQHHHTTTNNNNNIIIMLVHIIKIHQVLLIHMKLKEII